MRTRLACFALLIPFCCLATNALLAQSPAKADYPFRDIQLSDDARIDDLLSRLTRDEKIDLMSGSPKIPRLGLSLSGQVEGLHGLALGGPAEWGGKGLKPLPTTTFPQEKGLGATWDTALMQEVGALEGYEARYHWQMREDPRGGVVVRAPNADLSRDPRWGRTEESMGEDPFLVGSMTVAFIHGLQGPDARHWQAASLMKHFLANENENHRSSSSSNFDERLFREYYSVPFRMGFEEGGSRAVMAAYNAWNGRPMMVHPVLKDVMIGEWHNDGLICTDGGALGLLISDHKSYADKEHGAAAAVNAGINHFLDTYQDDLKLALKDNLVSEAELDARLHNLLRLFLRLGELDPSGIDPYAGIGVEADGKPVPWERASSRELVRKATDESIVLLKNNAQRLPLDVHKLHSIAIVGKWADTVLLDWYSGTPAESVSIVEGIRKAAGSAVQVEYVDGSDLAKATEAAHRADVVLAVVGNHPYCNAGWEQCPVPSNGKEAVDRKTITLEDESLVKALFAANPQTIEVLRSSFPYAITWSQDHLPAIVHMTHNSQEEGNGLADVLFGRYNPAGRLTQTWPTGDDQLLPMMDYDITHGNTYLYSKRKPLYAFGYGLSYTHFAYEAISLDAPQIKADGSVVVSVRVKNNGTTAGDEVVQLYASHENSQVTRPQLELKGFVRVHLDAGQATTLPFTVKARDLAYWDAAHHQWHVEADKVRLLAGGSSDNLPLSDEVKIATEATYKP